MINSLERSEERLSPCNAPEVEVGFASPEVDRTELRPRGCATMAHDYQTPLRAALRSRATPTNASTPGASPSVSPYVSGAGGGRSFFFERPQVAGRLKPLTPDAKVDEVLSFMRFLDLPPTDFTARYFGRPSGYGATSGAAHPSLVALGQFRADRVANGAPALVNILFDNASAASRSTILRCSSGLTRRLAAILMPS